MSEAKRCPQCQAEIPAEAPEGLCPQCLLGAAMKPATQDADSATAGFSPSASRFMPPTPEALQAALPQLEVLQLLGQGGMGAVYKARQPGLDRLVAVKILPPEVSRDPAFAERFTREARSLAKLNHPNIVGVYDFGQSGGYCWFVMEFVDGIDLRQAIRSGELKPAEVLKIVPQICEALQFAHDEGIVHRDIKPENILLDRRGRVKIADFGLAKLLGLAPQEVSLTGTRQVMGTMHYMAPEQIEGTRNVDHRADIYSLGVTFYEMLTGELPIGRFAAPSKKVQIDVRLDEVVLRSLEKEPEQRYQHASEIKAEMEDIGRTPPPEPRKAAGPTADDLEQLVLQNRFSKWMAVKVYRNRTGADLKNATAAVEAIAEKHGISFPPITGQVRILSVLTMAAILAVLLLCSWIYDGLSPILAIPIMLALASPCALAAWRQRGTPKGRLSAVLAGAVVAPTLGIPIARFLIDPEKTLSHWYAVTGVAPGPHDVLFLRLLFSVGFLALLGRLLWIWSKSRQTHAASSVKPATPTADAEGLPKSLWALQLFACFLGLFAGFVPNFSHDLPSWGLVMEFSSVENGPILASQVFSGSPWARAGLRPGDWIRGNYYELQRRFENLKVGETQSFDVYRGVVRPIQSEQNRVQIEVTGGSPLLNEIWYADIGYPIAGAFFLCMGLLIFATASLNPIPWWRPLLAAAVGLGTAIGFFLALHGDNIFSSYVLWTSGSAPFPGSTTTFHQGFVGIGAGVLLVMLAALELRCRILNPGPARPVLPNSTTPALNRGPSYLRTVVVPMLAFGIVLLALAGVGMYAFSPRAGARNPGGGAHAVDPLGDPQTLALIGVSWAATAFLFLNGIWLYRALPSGGFGRRTFHAAFWSIACLVLFAVLWSPANLGDGYIDRALWPYHGSIESTVSLKPRFLVPDPTDYRRLVITETREIQARGRSRDDARFTRHDFVVQLDLGDGSSRQIQIDALANRSFQYRKDDGTKVLGPLMDLQVALAWMKLPRTAEKVGKRVENPEDKEQTAISIDRQTQFWLDLIQSRAREVAGNIPGRLDMQAAMFLNAYRGQTAGVPFFDPTGSEKASFEPDVPILYVGVPVMLAVWGLGLWLLSRRRAGPLSVASA